MAFSFLQLWKKSEGKSAPPVKSIPLLATLTPTQLRLLQHKLRRTEFKKGDIVYKAGEIADAFYIIASGRFRVIGSKQKTIGVLSQGEYFGESSILLDRPHSATIEAKKDGLVLKLDKKDFQNLIKEIPSLSIHLSRTLGHRLAKGDSSSEVYEREILSFFDYGSAQERHLFVRNLAGMLGTNARKKIILVTFDTQEHGQRRNTKKQPLSLATYNPGNPESVLDHIEDQKGSFQLLQVSNGVDGEELEKRVSSLLGMLNDRYDFVLLDLPSDLDGISVKAAKQSDVIYFLIPEEERNTSKTSSYLEEFASSFGFTTDEIRLIIKERKDEKTQKQIPYRLNDATVIPMFAFLPQEPALLTEQNVDELPFTLAHPDSPYSKTIRFLSRELTGKLVGLVLGSGAAFGFAHIGVIKALEEAEIPIDIISGSSIGALVGGLWASGFNAASLERVARSLDRKSIFFKLVGLTDFSLPHRGFFKGNRVNRFLRHYVRRIMFRRLRIPVKIIAADLFTAEQLVFDNGDLVDAIRASISIPGIFRPVRKGEDVYIDGGVVDPLPVKVLSRYGVKKIIAVNVLPSPDDHIQRKEYHESQNRDLEQGGESRTLFQRLLGALGRAVQKRFRDNVFNVLMNTIQFLEYRMAESNAANADIVIHPVIPNSHWAEFYSVDKFVRCGEDRTKEQIEDIKKLVEEDV